MQKTTHFCLDSATAPPARSEAGAFRGKTKGRVVEMVLSSEEHHCPGHLQWPFIPCKPHTLRTVEVCPSPVPIHEKFTDNKTECIRQGWTFSPRMSHYQVLIMLIRQPLESCPAFHRQRWEERMIIVGAAPYFVKYSPSVPSCNSLCEAPWFMATAVLDP